MIAPTTIKAYIAELVSAFRKIELMDFLHELHTRIDSEQDLSFMEYFMELCSEENEDQFIVHHEKLIEFGVATSSQSNHVKRRISDLGMTEGEDYRQIEVFPSTGGNPSKGGRPKKDYFLTPRAFKLCLMRAKKEKDQAIDVQRYAEYFLFIEKVIYYYSQYESSYKEALLRNKDGVIDSLRDEIREQSKKHSEEARELKSINLEHPPRSSSYWILLMTRTPQFILSTVLTFARVDYNVRAQRKKVVATMSKYIEGDYTTNRNLPVRANHAIAIPPIYFPNATVLINRVVERFTKIVRKQKIKDFNETFKAEIKARTKVKLTISGFPVKMSSLSFDYYPNEVMTFNEVMMMVVEEIKGAQGSAIDLPATKQLSILADKHRALAEKRFVKNGSANEKQLLDSLNDDIAQAARDLSENIFKGVFETPASTDESESDDEDEM
ncbi:hypothetical protein PC129_g14821 [Phytophthora cactorum]|uniref:Uncharacterized protein n=1 Tax=Phytophthora cactorum TaxID=29920 RepID=A0A329RUS7_9STRA|nr:hypothetical protein Pcac1_g28557 [Phytophthora cactorum]KAG2809457.1 hypothetical protein PC112_g16500 [Phytophthora cactorum]KAG2811098.1 hypothetical protein PC111_g15379 [Phytophthora cactorum]KAG2850739.1 hypothetical protein PC113_g16504 [Phytophthora cactorum]KAG2889316.1 hypothetical protein PC114_g18017 [Phytophthora cactorum]